MKTIDKENLSEAVGQVIEGKVIVFPSETSYGLSCDATNQSAVDKIFAIKERAGDKTLLIVVPSVEDAKKYLEWNEQIDEMAKKHWPGPLTIVGSAKLGNMEVEKLADGAVSKDGTIAVRASAFPELKNLSEKTGRPIISTSANVSGENNLFNSEEIKSFFANRDIKPDAFYDCGDLPSRPPTTIVKVANNTVDILRQGEIDL